MFGNWSRVLFCNLLRSAVDKSYGSDLLAAIKCKEIRDKPCYRLLVPCFFATFFLVDDGNRRLGDDALPTGNDLYPGLPQLLTASRASFSQ